MNCSSTNGRVDIINSNNLNQFLLYDKIPKNDCNTFYDAMIGNFTDSNLSRAFFCKENIQIIQNAIRKGVYELSNEQYIIDNRREWLFYVHEQKNALFCLYDKLFSSPASFKDKESN